jgi:hypothetical protein
METDLILLAYGMACVFGAAIVRGYSGIFSLLSITSLSLFLGPGRGAAFSARMEIAASICCRHLARGALAVDRLLRSAAHRPPIGVWILASMRRHP